LNRVVLPGLPVIQILLLLQFTPITLFCQFPGATCTSSPSDTGSIYSVFQRETDEYQPTQEIRKRKAIKSSLPKNWNQIPVSTEDTLYIPGISDPGLPDTTAFRQAFLRAAGLAALASGCQGTYLSDLYFKTRFSTSQSRYEDLYRFQAGSSLRFREIRVVTSFRLKSKEIYLLLAIPKARNRGLNQIEISGNLYNYNVNDVLVRRIDCAVLPSPAFFPGAFTDSVAFYQYNRNFSNIRNLRNQWGSAPDKYDYFYPGDSEKNEDLIVNSSSSCNYGLWIAMLHQVFDALNNYMFKYSEQTQTLNEQGNAVRNQLTREKTNLLLTFTINDINLNNNSLMVKIAISHEN
jgi:hypothetical protein